MVCKTNTHSPEQQRHFFFSKKKCVREQHLEKNDIVETLDVSMYNVPKAGKELG